MGRGRASEVSWRSVTIFGRQVGDARALHLPAQEMRGAFWQRAQQLAEGNQIALRPSRGWCRNAFSPIGRL
jgi:hypothetical protein